VTAFVPVVLSWWETASYIAITVGVFLLGLRVLRSLPPEEPTVVLRRLYEHKD
jgi:hypothetical protein